MKNMTGSILPIAEVASDKEFTENEDSSRRLTD